MPRVTLRRREKIFIALFVILTVTGIGSTLLRGVFKTFADSKARAVAASDRLDQARDLQAAVLDQRSGQTAISDYIKKRPPRFNLYDFMNAKMREAKLEDRMDLEEKKLGPTTPLDRVQVTLSGVSMQEIVDFLHLVDAGNNLVVLQQLTHLREARDGKGLDCMATFISPKAS